MNWKKEAEKELREYNALKNSLDSLNERLLIAESNITSTGGKSDSTPVIGGGNKYEDKLLSYIVEKERLTLLLEANKKRISLIERGLAVLTDSERKTINRFYIQNMSYTAAVEVLRNEISYEERNINRIRNQALYKYTIAEFGLPEF